MLVRFMTDLKMGASWAMAYTPEMIRDEALKRFQERAKDKYDAGQKEHGGIITDRILVDELENEVIDLWFYVQALKLKLSKMSR